MTDRRLATTVTAVGPLVPELLVGGRLILFGDQAPEELHEICALHRPDGEVGDVEPGDIVRIGEQTLTVEAVGEVANANLRALGHVTLRPAALVADPLPGEITVIGALPEEIHPGLSIQIQGRG
jgi:PTS system glucitol/sorbitol-specific IIA component